MKSCDEYPTYVDKRAPKADHVGKTYGITTIVKKVGPKEFLVESKGTLRVVAASQVARFKQVAEAKVNPELIAEKVARRESRMEATRIRNEAIRLAELNEKAIIKEQKAAIKEQKAAEKKARMEADKTARRLVRQVALKAQKAATAERLKESQRSLVESKRAAKQNLMQSVVGSTKGALRVVGVNPEVTRLLIQCECGTDCADRTLAAWDKVKDKSYTSCGCRMKQLDTHPEWKQEFLEACGTSEKYHGMSRTSLWGSYRSMMHRCYTPSHTSWAIYGGRGIEVCDEWREGFIPFMNWALANGWQEGFQLDRKSPHGHYTPENCRWLSQQDNLAAAKEMNHPIRVMDVIRPLKDWLVILKLTMNAYRKRLGRWGGDEVKALVIPDGYPEAKAKAHMTVLLERARQKGLCDVPLVVPLSHRLIHQ